MSRRKFFVGFGAVAGTSALVAVESVVDLASEEERVALAIEKFTGLKKKDVIVNFRFGSHLVTPNLETEIKSFKPTALLGEITTSQLEPAVLDAVPVEGDLKAKTLEFALRVLFPAQGSNPKEILFHNSKLKEFLTSGSPTIIASDVDLNPIFEENLGIKAILPFALLGAMPLVYVGGLATKNTLSYIRGQKTFNKLTTRRDFLKIAGLYGGLTIATYMVIGAFKSVAINDPPEVVSPFVSKFFGGLGKFAEIWQKPDPENPWLSLIKALINFRNTTMALNTWVAIANRTGKEQERLLFYAGSAHRGLLNQFIEGPRSVEKKVAEYANGLLTIGLDMLLEKSKTLEIPGGNGEFENSTGSWRNDWIINRLISYAQMFPEPDLFNDGEIPHSNLKTTLMPKTPGRIFKDELQKILQETSNLKSLENDQKLTILLKLSENLRI